VKQAKQRQNRRNTNSLIMKSLNSLWNFVWIIGCINNLDHNMDHLAMKYSE
jgi:hypothetical protein